MGWGATVAIALSAVVLASSLLSAPAVALHPTAGLPSSSAASPQTTTDRVPVPAGVTSHRLPLSAQYQIGLTVVSSRPSTLATFLHAVADPSSPQYRHFLSYGQFEARFAPSGDSIRAVEASLRGVGATGVRFVAATSTVEGVVSGGGLAALLGVVPVSFPSASGRLTFTVAGTPVVPLQIRSLVTGIEGLSGTVVGPPTLSRAHVTTGPSRATHGPSEFVRDGGTGAEMFVGSDFTQAYEATALLPGNASSVPGATYPYHVSVATLLASSYNSSTSTDLPPFDPAVVQGYYTNTFPAGWPHPNVTGVPVPEVGVPNPPAPGAFGAWADNLGVETENSLDLEMAGSLAPGASLYTFYFAGRLLANAPFLSNIASYLSDDLAAALSYGSYGTAPLATVTCSFGMTDLNSSAWNAGLETAAAMGVTVLAASGDQGNAPDVLSGRTVGPAPLWPSTAAFNDSGVVSVGGISLALAGSATSTYRGGNLTLGYDTLVQGIAWTTAWYDTTDGPGGYAGTEGGLSGTYAEPWWQFHSAAQPPIVDAAVVQGVTTLGRAGPDLAFPANSTLAYIAETTPGNPVFGLISGTSIASPVLAGLLADVVAVESVRHARFSPLGYVAPEIYRLASYFAANPTPGADPFVDTFAGSNAMFSASVGWDAVTGWGGLLGPLFLAADLNPVESNYTYTGPTPTLPASPQAALSLLTATLIVAGAATAAAVAVVILVYRRPAPGQPADVFDQYVAPPSYGPPGGAVPVPPATFACPYCGHDRPAEAGPCPTCGRR